jgi:hypothetical protein
MFTRVHVAATALILSICAASAYSQSVVGQNSLRARLPFSGANEPASLQSAVKSQPRPSTSGAWSPQRIWGYGQTSAVTYYRPRAPWLPPSSSIAPTTTIGENWSWMDNWENEQLAQGPAIHESTRAVLGVMSTRPNALPWLAQTSESQTTNYPIGYQPTPPIAQPSAASAAVATLSSGAVDAVPSQPLSVPSAVTSAPIPY